MTNNTPNYRSFHPFIADAYTAVHQWLNKTVPEANGYKKIDPRGQWKDILHKEDWKHTAFQYYYLFPSHYFKAAHTLENIVGEDKLEDWLRHKQRMCVLDVGCGAGAGSAAFLEAILQLKERGKITNKVDVLFIGIDPSVYAIGLYHQLMSSIKNYSSDSINLDFKIICHGFPKATGDINNYLKKEALLRQVPFSNVLVMQLNVISPLSQNYRDQQKDYEQLRKLGIPIDDSITEGKEVFGEAEADAYRRLVEDVPIDVMHILTIGTKNIEKYVQIGTDSTKTLEERIKEMADALNQIVGNRHIIEQIAAGNYHVFYDNPYNSYWRDKNRISYDTDFYADFQRIISADLTEDKDWNAVISLENLRSAWAKAQHNLRGESLYDETEIRLFDMNIDHRLDVLQKQLYAYANDVALTNEMICYKFPKNNSTTRPRGLSRFEEEILSVAIVQNLGDRSSKLRGSSYAYRISNGKRDTEYLYEYWFSAYCYYMKKARASAKNYPNGAIIRVDIESFYTRIIQSQLCNELSKELTESQRIRWLIRLLLSKNINEHEVGQGITQGSIGSGFYANIYLTPIDVKFGHGNQWAVEFHRYVDDMIFVIPNPDDMTQIENVLNEELQKLGLNLNEGKTDRIYKMSEFLDQSEDDTLLEKLSERFNGIIYLLWILNSEHRAILASSHHNDQLWWHYIKCYQQCLKSIRIYTQDRELSRKIYKYLFSQKSRERDLVKQKEIFGLEGELKSTRTPDSESFDVILQWAACFTSSNNEWNENRNKLRKELIDLFNNSWEELRKYNGNNFNEVRKLQRYIRFALNRLSVLGLEDILPALMEILRESFWVIRDPLSVLENIARQGFLAEVRSLLTYYQNSQQSVEYMKAITIRAMRFLPNIDAQEWEVIVEFATISGESVTVAEKLMATETWLYLGHKYSEFKQNRHIEAVKNALRAIPAPPSRLEKNYLLILGEFEPNAVQEFSVNVNDPMLVEARDIALQGNTSEIFDLPELKILRENYYSGRGSADSEEDPLT
ncbi:MULTISPECIES: RNA-directed DNA polymerase [Planktothrix]|uniref:RNA-directed DNA polymerase n=1 Tax=Planktothrix TaxID=54304 RepID=UPI000402B832|nr:MULTISPECIES: RNA-directed DNA polymerase [Planktothrix]CAD5976215.1 hypothetical protein NO758_04128 [Planktothrix agardhii]